MAYAEPFDPLTPADSDEIAEGDDAIRQFKRAVLERMETFFADFDADPLAPIAYPKILSGTLTLDATDSTFGSLKFKEFDVTVTGAKTGALAHAMWEADDETPYPSPAGSPPDATGSVSLNGRDLIIFKAWCLEDNTIRVRMINPSGSGVGGVAGEVIRAWAVQAGVAT